MHISRWFHPMLESADARAKIVSRSNGHSLAADRYQRVGLIGISGILRRHDMTVLVSPVGHLSISKLETP